MPPSAPELLSAMPADDFAKSIRNWTVVRRIAGEGYVLTLADTRERFVWCIGQPDASDTVLVYSASSFDRHINAAAEATTSREASVINRLIQTDRQMLAVGPQVRIRGRSYTWHAEDIRDPHDDAQPGAVQ